MNARAAAGLVGSVLALAVAGGAAWADGTSPALAVWSHNSTGIPRYSVYSGGAWSAAATLATVGSEANYYVVRNCPARDELLVASLDQALDVNVFFYSAGVWSAVTEVETNTGAAAERCLDAAYEQVSGDGLIVYWDAGAAQVAYRTTDGTAISGETQVALASATSAKHIALYPRPGTNQIVLLVSATVSGARHLAGMVWDGGAWGAWTTFETALQTDTEECFAMTFESESNEGLLVYIESGQSTPRYVTWDGAIWSPESSAPTVGGTGTWVRLAADPCGDQVLMAVLDTSNDINLNSWDGSSWGTNTEAETSTGASDRRLFDIAYEGGGRRALVVYGQSSSNLLRYRVWDGWAWTAERNGTDVGGQPRCVQAVRGSGADEVLIGVYDGAGDLNVLRWTASAIGATTEVDATMGGTAQSNQFMVDATPSSFVRQRVSQWQEAAP